jgi:hypothetical protein
MENPQGFSRFGRPKSAPIVHRKHGGTVPLPHRFVPMVSDLRLQDDGLR